MTFTYEPNRNFEVSSEVFLDFKTRAVANGATVERSGDGLAAFNASGDVVSLAAPNGTANSIQNVNSWFVVSWPNGRSLCFRNRSGSGITVLGYYSAAAGFTGGDATTRATATDEIIVKGSINGITGGNFDSGIAGRFEAAHAAFSVSEDDAGAAHMVAHAAWGDADEDYAFYYLIHIRGDREPRGGFFIDTLTDSPAYVEDAAVVCGGANAAELWPWEQGIFGGAALTPGQGNQLAVCWPQAIGGVSGGTGFGQNAVSLNWGHRSTFAPEWTTDADRIPPLGRNPVPEASPWHGGYDAFGMLLWISPGRADTVYSQVPAMLGRSRLFKLTNRAEPRDISTDRLWKFIEGGVAYRWNGSTDPLI
jgi:hypothetical protein